MGTPISDFVSREKYELEHYRELSGKGEYETVAVDLPGFLYQFFYKITGPNNEALTDDEGRKTSHLNGLYYRTMNLLANRLRPVFVLEGDAPTAKSETIEARRQRREEVESQLRMAEELGLEETADEIRGKYVDFNNEDIENTIPLFEALGCPVVQAPGEAEAQCARMAAEGIVDYAVSQDYDTLLFGAPVMLQNLNSSSVDHINLQESLTTFWYDHLEFEDRPLDVQEALQRLIWTGIMLGSDYNRSPHGVGPVSATTIASNSTTFDDVMNECDRARTDGQPVDRDEWYRALEIYTDPNVNVDFEPEWTLPDRSEIHEVLVEKHDFDSDRVMGAFDGVEVEFTHTGLDDFL